MKNKLAIKGGKPVRTKPFPRQKTIGYKEIFAVVKTMLKKRLSYFRGNWIPEFYGGPEVQALEKEFSKKFNVKYSISVNSCTSALQVACLALRLKKGDEVIVTPWSMSCSATAPLVCNATPVFADVNPNNFILDPECIKKKINNKTKAIIVVDLFGQPYKKEIDEIAKKHNLYIIEDAAQAIGSKRGKQYAGTLGDFGCFSFTQGKHLTSGEGGMLVTNNPELALKAQMIRNHAEAVVGAMEQKGLLQQQEILHPGISNFHGYNMRITEMQAAMLRVQLQRLDNYIKLRQKNALKLKKIFEDVGFLHTNSLENTHSFYVSAITYYSHVINKIDRDIFVKALNAELCGGETGRPDKEHMLGCGYIKPLNAMPLFNHDAKKDTPNAYDLWKKILIVTTIQGLPLTRKDFRDIKKAVNKVVKYSYELQKN